MFDIQHTIERLASPATSTSVQSALLNDFAEQLGWKPSFHLFAVAPVSSIAHAHLVIEHGLESAAVISFLDEANRFRDLTTRQQFDLLSISYNNIVDWHVSVHPSEATYVSTRNDPVLVVDEQPIARSSYDCLRYQRFQEVVGKRLPTNLPALDAALVDTISYWRSYLTGEMPDVEPTDITALLNAVLLVRAVEDHQRAMHGERLGEFTTMHDMWQSPEHSAERLGDLLLHRLNTLISDVPDGLIDQETVLSFNGVPPDTGKSLLFDFYRNKYAPYDYDFSLISKRALSRIYERYVAVLRRDPSPQATLPSFPRRMIQDSDKSLGAVYTPQFIARFFTKYLREQMPPQAFRSLLAADPSCGSGIFLRNLLELQCDTDEVSATFIGSAFGGALGIDIDGNACQAARLSLSLLHLVLTDRLPSQLNIVAAEAIDYFRSHRDLAAAFDVVVANPPFVTTDAQSAEMRQRILEFTEGHSVGKRDLYLAFLLLGLEMLKPGGYGMFVLPQSFLFAESAAGIRKLIRDKCWVRCLADLSAVQVFENTGSYAVLIVFQKRERKEGRPPTIRMLKCNDDVNYALENLVLGRSAETGPYSIYEADQAFLDAETWAVFSRDEMRLRERYRGLCRLDELADTHQGFISGADDVFLRRLDEIPVKERSLYAPYLPDRHMRPYTVPAESDMVFFHPGLAEINLTEETLALQFSNTWRHLARHRARLEGRAGIKEWWRPTRPRRPRSMLRPKVVTPHMVLVPRFAVDREGRYAVSHSPFICPKVEPYDDILLYLLAVLNSSACFWFVAGNATKYSRGYAVLEPKTLRGTPIPDPRTVDKMALRHLLNLVRQRLVVGDESALALEREIDDVVAGLYGLSEEERRALALGGLHDHSQH